MTLRQLEYFVEIVKQNSFTKAAAELFVSQSALSKAIKMTESELNTILIDRNAKDFMLTKDGQTFYKYADEVLSFYNYRTKVLKTELNKNQSKLVVGITPTSGAMFFFNAIYNFRSRYPLSDLMIEEVSTGEGIQRVLDGTLDISVVLEPFEDRRFEKQPVIESEAVLIVSNEHPLSARKCISFHELKDEPILTVGSGYKYYDLLKEKFQEVGIEPNIEFESNQWEFIYEMVANNQGVSILPKPLVEKFNNARVKQIHLLNPEFPWGLSLIRRKDREITPIMENFWKLCGNDFEEP